MTVDLRVDYDSWQEVSRVLKSFAADDNWSVRDTSTEIPDVVRALEISLCNTDDLIVYVNEKRWAERGYAAPSSMKLLISMYGDAPDDVWHPLAQRLIDRLEQNWPGALRFVDGQANEIAPPPFITP
jgi:hypothetical protein